MNIPFFSLQRQWENLKKQIMPGIHKVLDSQQYIGGTFVKDFEEKFAQKVGAQFAVSCNSGTDALWLALKALELKPNDLVLTTPFSFIASSSEIVAHGGIPVFIDVDPSTYLLDPQAVKKWLEQNAQLRDGKAVHKASGNQVAGILPVNIFGQCADFTALKQIADEWNLWMVEDAAQSIGATHHDRPSGSLGTISIFSFYPTKNLSGCGDGGMTTTSDPLLAGRLLRLRNHGRTSHYEYSELGINSRLDALQAVILQEKLEVIDELNARRVRTAQKYDNALSKLAFISLPEKMAGTHTYHQYTFTTSPEIREALRAHLENKGVATRVYYPESLDTIPFLNKDQRFLNSCPFAQNLPQIIVALPIWPELTDEEVEYVIEAIKQFEVVGAGKSVAREVRV